MPKLNNRLLVLAISAMLFSPATFAELPKPIAAVADFLGLGSKETAVTDVPDNNYAEGQNPDLSVLESEPNPLHNIDGVHQGRVPLRMVSPNTLKTFVSVVDLVRRDYVEEVNDEELFKYAMNGMLKGLDHHAEFLDSDAFANLQSFTAGNVASVGLTAVWQNSDNHWVVNQIQVNSSADKANIKVGDYLHQIGDTKLTETQNENDVKQLLTGIAGTELDVVVSHAGRSKRTVSLQRNEELKSSIETVIYDGVAVIKLPVFQNNTRQQILDSLGRAGVPIQGIVLDLRNNPGGVLESAGSVASLFMRNQVVAQVAGRDGVEKVLNTEGAPLLIDLPVIVIQNRYSASAAEVLASSLQTQKRALIVGETSYGKGSVQSVIPIGDNQAVKMTTAHYLTADGQKIDGVGVLPDVRFDDVPSTDISQDDWLHQSLVLMSGAKLSTGIDFAPVGGF